MRVINKYRKIIFHTTVLTIILGTLLAPVIASPESGWKLALQKDGIEVSTRGVPGSDLDEFMGTPAAPQWMADCREARTIRKIDENVSVVLNVTKTPWPVYDRETLLISTKQKDAKAETVIFEFHSVNDPAVPVGKKNVRIPAIDGRWVLTAVDEGHTEVTYTVKSNPGGSIPKFIARQRSRDIPYKTLLGLKEMVKKDKYKETTK
jgi:hypothetical protein